jgi:hypothetical protein
MANAVAPTRESPQVNLVDIGTGEAVGLGLDAT